MTSHNVQTFQHDFRKFCSAAAVDEILSSNSIDFAIDDRPGKSSVNDFAGGEYENPIVWYREYNVALLIKDVLFDNMEMKYVTLVQYGYDQPEYVKWKLFGYNIVICFEYINKGKLNKALDIISDIEKLLESIKNSETFLNSIRTALNHVSFSMKTHVLKLCYLDTDHEYQMPFIMPNNMDNINKAGLFGIQALFFYEYDTLLSKNSILKAISLNKDEPEWYYLLARILRNCAKTSNKNYIICEEEFEASKTAVEIGNKVQHKLHLSSVYLQMCKNKKFDEDTRNQYLNTGLNIFSETIDTTNDLILLKYSLPNLSKCTHAKNFNSWKMLKKLLSKLLTSDNGYVHGSIGNYYLFNKMDYSKALFHLKKAYDAKSFGCSIDYIYTLYKIDSSTAPVEQMLVEMLKTFPHPVHQEKILSQIISYLIITKDDLIGALIYIPMLLSLKNITCVYNLQHHRMKFHNSLKNNRNLLDVMSEKCIAALKDQTLSIDYKNIIIEMFQILKYYKRYSASILMKHESLEKNSNTISVPLDKTVIEKWSNNNNNNNTIEDTNYVKNKDEQNYETLKQDPHIFLKCYQKRMFNNTIELQSQFDSLK